MTEIEQELGCRIADPFQGFRNLCALAQPAFGLSLGGAQKLTQVLRKGGYCLAGCSTTGMFMTTLCVARFAIYPPK